MICTPRAYARFLVFGHREGILEIVLLWIFRCHFILGTGKDFSELFSLDIWCICDDWVQGLFFRIETPSSSDFKENKSNKSSACAQTLQIERKAVGNKLRKSRSCAQTLQIERKSKGNKSSEKLTCAQSQPGRRSKFLQK